MNLTQIRHLQVSPAVRLRREAWGGVAFHRQSGDLIEVDAKGFTALVALKRALTVPALQRSLGRGRHGGQRTELIVFLRTLEQRGFIQPAPPDAQPLPADRWIEAFAGHPDQLRAPLVAHWGVTCRCNLQCAFCYAESGPQRSPGPEPSLRLRLVERLTDWGVLEVALGGGEPTILLDFPELLAAIRSGGMVPNVTTNGTIRSAAVLRALAKHAGVVHLSADRPDLLDSARGAGIFSRLRETACALRAAGVRLGVNLLLTPDNIGAIDRSLQACLDLGVQAVTFLRPKGAWVVERWPNFPAGDELARLTRDLKSFMHTRPPLRLYVDTALRGEWAQAGLLKDPEPDVLGCGGAQRHVAVTPEGDLYPCSHLRQPQYRLGNLLTGDLEQVWAQGAGHAGRERYLRHCQGVRCPCQHRDA
jgi:radical SAM protein with 4Fe4S-binding SPASM domain